MRPFIQLGRVRDHTGPRRSTQARLASLLVAFGAIAAAIFAYRHRQTLLAQQHEQPQCPRPNFAVLPHEEPVEALQPAPSPLPSLSPASWGSAISSAMWMLFLKRKPLRYHGERPAAGACLLSTAVSRGLQPAAALDQVRF